MEDFHIIEGKTHHVDQIVRVHLLAFPGFFLSQLGPFFLRTYYRSIVKSNDAISLVLTDLSGEVIGFCVGCKQSRGFNSRLLKNNFLDYIISVIVILALKPAGIIRLYKNLNKKSSATDDGLYSEVLSIAVNPEFNSRGFGNSLLSTFEKIALERGCTEISLTTDYYENKRVIEFYLRSGYSVMATFDSYPNRKMYRLIKKIIN